MNEQLDTQPSAFVFTLDDDEPVQATQIPLPPEKSSTEKPPAPEAAAQKNLLTQPFPSEGAMPQRLLLQEKQREMPEKTSDENNQSTVVQVAETVEEVEVKPEWEQKLEVLLESKKNAPISRPDIQSVLSDRVSSPSACLSLAPAADSEKKTSPENPEPFISRRQDQTEADESLTPEQRKEVYLAYLAHWQQCHNQRQRQGAETAVVLQEDWLASQDCLQRAEGESEPAVSIRLDKHNKAEAIGQTTTADTNADAPQHAAGPGGPASVAVAHVHVIDPQAVEGRIVRCLSEAELIGRLLEKLRPHLAGMVNAAIQQHSARWANDLQNSLLTQLPDAIDATTRRHLSEVLTPSRPEAVNAPEPAAESKP